MNLFMYYKVWLLAEFFPTFIALMGFFSRMNSLVSFRITAPAETFLTFLTSIWFLPWMVMYFKRWGMTRTFCTLFAWIGSFSWMNSTMYYKFSDFVEVTPTLFTLIGFLSCMNSLMYYKVCLPAELFPTFIALMGFLSRMNELVCFKITALEETFPTFCTRIWLLPWMPELMYFKSWGMTETFFTFFTHIRFLSCMNSLMYLKMWIVSEGLSAFMAFVCFLSCVYTLMAFKFWTSLEAHATLYARTVFPFRMHWLRCFQVRAKAFVCLPCVKSCIFWAPSETFSILQTMTQIYLIVTCWTFHWAFPQRNVLLTLWALKSTDAPVSCFSHFVFRGNTARISVRSASPLVFLILPRWFISFPTVLIFILPSFWQCPLES